jgi:hypothetical protein
MFEITPQDIAQLDDKQLRTLVGLLCEAELRKRGYSTAAVTWGGDQNARDGGLDVRVSLPDEKPSTDSSLGGQQASKSKNKTCRPAPLLTKCVQKAFCVL